MDDDDDENLVWDDEGVTVVTQAVVADDTVLLGPNNVVEHQQSQKTKYDNDCGTMFLAMIALALAFCFSNQQPLSAICTYIQRGSDLMLFVC